jgi:hypothetical protein
MFNRSIKGLSAERQAPIAGGAAFGERCPAPAVL